MIASQRFGEARGGRRRSSRVLGAPRCVLPRYKVFNSPAHAKPTKISSSFAMTRRMRRARRSLVTIARTIAAPIVQASINARFIRKERGSPACSGRSAALQPDKFLTVYRVAPLLQKRVGSKS